MAFAGMSTRKVAKAIQGMGVEVKHVTVFNWAPEYGNLMERYVDQIRPLVGEQWRTDEIYMSIRGACGLA